MATALQVPTDIFRLVFGHLDVKDVLNLRQVCKEFHELSNSRSVWDALLHKQVIQRNMPIPGLKGKPIDSLTAQDLEQSMRTALRLHRNWTADSPVLKRRVNLKADPAHRIVSLFLLPSAEYPRLISLSMTYGAPRIFVLQCWDLGLSNPVCIARRELLRFGGMAVNKTISDGGIIAILNPRVEIISLDLQATDPEHGFRTTTTFEDETSGVHFFSGSSILTKDSHGRLYFWDINSPQRKTELRNTSLDQPTPLLDVIVAQNFILALKFTTLELYILPDFADDSILQPVLVFQWPWRIDNAAMTIRHRTTSSEERRPNGVYVVVRFGSYFPWSINLLHHYEIRPDPEGNLPYEFPPVLRETIASPIRLHATSDLAIGPYGTAMWTDSHTEDYFDHADRGQRLAGRFSPYLGGDEDEEVKLSDQIATASATSVYAYHEEDSWVRVAFDEAEGLVVLGRDDGVISVLEFA